MRCCTFDWREGGRNPAIRLRPTAQGEGTRPEDRIQREGHRERDDLGNHADLQNRGTTSLGFGFGHDDNGPADNAADCRGAELPAERVVGRDVEVVRSARTDYCR